MTPAVETAPSAEERLEHMAAQLDEVTAEVRYLRAQREAAQELIGDLAPVSRQALASTTERLADLDERGYVDFARSGLDVIDRVVTSFTTEDVEALGDNVVLILETVKEMTQPEVMALLRRTAAQVNEPAGVPAEPPKLRALLRELRDPDVRRGLGRLLTMLRTVGAQPTPHTEEVHD